MSAGRKLLFTPLWQPIARMRSVFLSVILFPFPTLSVDMGRHMLFITGRRGKLNW